MRVNWNHAKSELLKRTRGIGFDDALGIFELPYVVQTKNDDPEQYKAIGFSKGGDLISLIVEIRHDHQGEYELFVTLWKATPAEVMLYEQSS